MNKSNLVCLSSFLLLLLCGCHHGVPQATGYGYWAPDPGFAAELGKQDSGSNGIEVDEPKIYDDSSLRLMLDQARQRLAAINGLNEAGLVSHLGAVTGSSIDQTQLGVQVSGPSLPGVTSTATGPTSQTTTNNGLPSGQTALPASSTVTSNPSQSVVTTTPSASPPGSPSVPSGLAFTPPTGMAGSALDVLNEQMQLTYEIANLQLLLEGALSDRFVKNQRIIKPRTTIGFPISLTPQARYRDSVAVVEIEVETAKQNLSDENQPEPPAITTILPREKTYNVAAITDHMTSIGAGAVISTIGVSGSFATGHKTYYVVQDQDTVAIQRPADPDKKNTTSFAWEFRPVLGEAFVRGGLKQTFVQLALPLLGSDCLGAIRVRTYWRRFDRKNGIVREPIEGSTLSRKRFAIPHYDLTPNVEDVVYQDLGDGTVLVNVKGSFLAGTYVQLGPTRYDASKGLVIEESGLTFIAPAAAFARWTAKVVSRDGKQANLLSTLAQTALPKLDQFSCAEDDKKAKADNKKDEAKVSAAETVEIRDVRIAPDRGKVEIEMQKSPGMSPNPAGTSLLDGRTHTEVNLVSSVAAGFNGDRPIVTAEIVSELPCPFGSIHIKKLMLKPMNESETELFVEFDPVSSPLKDFPDDVLLDIGHKVFGLADTAVERDLTSSGPSITAIIPTLLLVTGRKVRAFRMFWTSPDGDRSQEPRNRCFNDVRSLSDFDLDSAVERVVLVSVDKDGKATYLLYGNGLKAVKVL